jgi:hypothetical protein
LIAEEESRAWLSASSEHEGFPIYFRRPDVRVAEVAALRPRYPSLLVITQRLSHVRPNGLPQPDYNDSLATLDTAVLTPFRSEKNGLVALVETFAGKRTYYVYLASGFDAQSFMSRVAELFPSESLSWKRHEDPAWKVFHGYASDFGFA